MTFLKLGSIFLITLLALGALTGCDRVQNVVVDAVPPTDTAPEVEPVTTKLIWLIDYPAGQKEAYLTWVASMAATLQAPEEITRIRSYDNRDPDASPHRLVEFEFNSFIDAMTYLNRPEIAAILGDLPNYSSNASVHTFIQRSDYTKVEASDWQVKGIFLINYPLGQKEAYLAWVTSISPTLIAPEELKAISSYDNYYGESPHRLVELEFANQEEATAYEEREELLAIEAELDTRTSGWARHVFILRSDYVGR